MNRITLRGAAVLLLAAPSIAQEAAAPASSDPQDLAARLEALERRQADELADLRFEVESLAGELDAARRAAAAPAAQRSNLLNPQITVFGNFLARSDDRAVWLEDDPSEERVDNTLSLREVEVDFRAAIDPWADGVLILSSEAELPGEYETGVEEGYVVLKKLPLLDSAPGGLKLKAGRFRPEFGRFNRIHLHDLPFVDYPRSLAAFLGEEGYVESGLSGQFFLPSPGDASTLQATLQVLGGGDAPPPGAGGTDLAGLTHVEWFSELSDAHSLDLGLSAWVDDDDRRLYGLDATYKWKPHVGGQWRSFLLGGEVFASDSDSPALDDAVGFFLWTQYQFSRSTYLGLRYDRSEELTDASLATDTLSTYLTYYTTEFLRFRLGLQHSESDVPELDDRDAAFFELNFVFGSHPVEPYWVNR